jgi:hypothetical protein
MKSRYTFRKARAFAVFNPKGIESCSTARAFAVFNPKGIESCSPGLARFPEGLPWVAAFYPHNPERVEYPRQSQANDCQENLKMPGNASVNDGRARLSRAVTRLRIGKIFQIVLLNDK